MTTAIIGIIITVISSMCIVVALGRMEDPNDSRSSAAAMLVSNVAFVAIGITVILTQIASGSSSFSATTLAIIISCVVIAAPAIVASIVLRWSHERNHAPTEPAGIAG